MKLTLNYTLIFLLGIIILSGCKEKDEKTIPECNIDNPLEELEWLKEMKDTCESSNDYDIHEVIVLARYKGKPVFYTQIICPACNVAFHFVLRDCNGDIVKEYNPGDEQKFQEEVEFIKILYTCPQN